MMKKRNLTYCGIVASAIFGLCASAYAEVLAQNADEIRKALKAGEDEELSARRTLLRSAGRLMEAVQSAEFALSGDEDRDGACSLIAQAEGEVQGVSSILRACFAHRFWRL